MSSGIVSKVHHPIYCFST
ncbi:hypothetical protein F383_36550 [Gossypium arboreum]|uniref:Uncharacterized protein n=1 Tax=Gossypium arboreum TaxID=29729 RepID=A0A0B0M9B4_GOSAR|nr:hypothetical protein F383_36550 [Gossypium arboreum]